MKDIKTFTYNIIKSNKSSVIEWFTYSIDTKKLFIKFKNTNIDNLRVYYDVPYNAYQELFKANGIKDKSLGHEYNEFIKGSYPTNLITDYPYRNNNSYLFDNDTNTMYETSLIDVREKLLNELYKIYVNKLNTIAEADILIEGLKEYSIPSLRSILRDYING